MTNPKVDWFFDKKGKWQEAYQELRNLVLDCGLTEELKWGCPCYLIQKSNIVLIHGFKDYCALLFMQGALLTDPKKILVQQTKNVQSARQIRFTSIDEILKNQSTIKAYIKEAIKNDKAGLKVELKATNEFEMPLEFQTALKEMSDLKTAFYKLTPGRQRGYLLYFSSAKQSKTRMERVEKCIPKILDNKGLDD
jgi:uncharacterized protein YdeI (YjbR/CyaY-like superfamily)